MSIEWAWGNLLHRRPETQEFVQKYGLKNFKVSGCIFGLKSIAEKTLGQPLCKAWGIWTNNPLLLFALDGSHVRCQGGHSRVCVEGKDTKHSGIYPDAFAKYINTVITTPISELHKMAETGNWPIVGR